MKSSRDDVPVEVDEGARNVRPRLFSPIQNESREKEYQHQPKPQAQQEQEQQLPSTPKNSAGVVSPLGVPSAKFVAKTPFFIVTEEEAWLSATTAAQQKKLPLFEEANRCWQQHRATGKMHHEPPWRLCQRAEDNREHPYYMQWLDTMELLPMEELLGKESSSGMTADSSDHTDEKRKAIADEKTDSEHLQQEK
ncbi:uncharacterized protein TM35_000073990 [Trypanosoma theileri]|uniref:Uncharacterized protein n=1 Tax=Trypanosoma theileri TaxID=67003 RepID=A0A1X0P254_9TRYP|nr:uncharacterized protein TM35_000073990 [Trypanosoma theileri]ORC90975.1 hypothetical protein TM35_000073990 [Trypanosoma theileri]